MFIIPHTLAGAHGGEGQRCELEGPDRSLLGKARTAWDQLYRDAGDNVQMDEDHGGYLNFFASVEPNGAGSLTAYFSSTGTLSPQLPCPSLPSFH